MKYGFPISIIDFKNKDEQELVKHTIFTLAQKSENKPEELFHRRPDPFMFRCVLTHEIPMSLIQLVRDKLPEDCGIDDIQFATLNLLYDASRHFNEDWNDYYRLPLLLDNDGNHFDHVVKVQCHADNQPYSNDFGRKTAMLNYILSAENSDEDIDNFMLTVVMNDSLGMNLAAYYGAHTDQLPEDLFNALEHKATCLRKSLENDPYLLHYRRIQEKHEEVANDPGFGRWNEEYQGYFCNHARSFLDGCVDAVELIDDGQSMFIRHNDMFAVSAENVVLGVRHGFQMRADLQRFYGDSIPIDESNHESDNND